MKVLNNIENTKIINLNDDIPSNIELNEDTNYLLFIKNLNSDITFNINDAVKTNVTIIFYNSDNEENSKYKIIFNLNNNSFIDLYIANVTNYNSDENIVVNLNGENSGVEYYSSTIANKNLNKISVLNIEHKYRNTYSNVKVYYVLKDTSKGFIRCSSNIIKGSSGSEAHQELRLLLLDEKASANSDPVLLIDENDIIASHANAIGMLDPDQIFYLKSRGLDEKTAHQLIINGYFEPIINTMISDDQKNMLSSILKEMI
ncbi:FeS assembly protein SufD [Spiroplasma litorale]|uniref:FeS assembly protein SufD n=1 Tax=Spiroplasma litorale TaxID=216942 RepID=A0A0K1W1B3_9MOLU|nr:SufD family Fe-S cluster assembly protein [Spiroplasma litorale]AKX33882.1 FeS assembly protein SufD [Spiroplasma litorale]